jgi:hypothetical protein
MTQSISFQPIAPTSDRLGWRQLYLVGLTALTGYSTGVAWQAQAVSYPLFGTVSAEDFAAYHLQYNALIPLPVIVPGFLTFLAGIAFFWARPPEVPRPAAAVVAATGLTSLLATVLWAIPMHDRLDRIGQDAATLDSLLQANLLRSVALTAGAVALGWCLTRLFRRPG